MAAFNAQPPSEFAWPAEGVARVPYPVFFVFRTSIDPIHHNVGEYIDKIVFVGDVPKFKERLVIADTSQIQSLLVTPI